jgi:hypothetical protein
MNHVEFVAVQLSVASACVDSDSAGDLFANIEGGGLVMRLCE